MLDATPASNCPTDDSSASFYDSQLASIKVRVIAEHGSLAAAIASTNLYFRVSLLGACNFTCTFCHNEGAPITHRLTHYRFEIASREARRVGFRRVQLTGGEPLLRSDIAGFIDIAAQHFSDVGITTNGSLLQLRLPQILGRGLNRLHISLQAESLADATSPRWRMPDWLCASLDALQRDGVNVRLNIPIAADSLDRASPFLQDLLAAGLSAKVFSILPDTASAAYPMHRLAEIVRYANACRPAGSEAMISLRDYAGPRGLRCPTCQDLARCAESSRSLRLGSDLVLRPCLATRAWDRPWHENGQDDALSESAYMALDW
jgi:cyclic pyranopterin phosphate synthase